MKAIISALVIIGMFASSAFADKPKTVDEAVQVLKTKWLKPEDRDWILRNTKDNVRNRLYMGFGTAMRNQFGLWGDNQALHDSCGSQNPEVCSVVILDQLWESIRRDADPLLVRQLDCQFQLAQSIHVSLAGFHQLTNRAMIQQLEKQIDSQLAAGSRAVSSCQNSLTLDIAGKPDMDCYVVAPHDKKDRQFWDDLTLERALTVMGTQNFFRTVHYPPKLTLDFIRPCQFPKPFPY